MPKSTQQKNKGKGQPILPSIVYDVIDRELKAHLTYFPSKGEITEGEIATWHRDLEVFQIKAIEWAFDCWRRNGRFFPVYGDILDLCIAYQPREITQKNGCDAECRRNHFRSYSWGYDGGDLLWMWAKLAEIDHKPSPAEWNKLLDELDSKRDGGAPPAAAEWRNTINAL